MSTSWKPTSSSAPRCCLSSRSGTRSSTRRGASSSSTASTFRSTPPSDRRLGGSDMANLDHVKDEALRARLEVAHQHLRKGKPTDAVKTLAEVFIGMVTDHPELREAKGPARRGRRMPLLASWP